jgi:hypothetical protein
MIKIDASFDFASARSTGGDARWRTKRVELSVAEAITVSASSNMGE